MSYAKFWFVMREQTETIFITKCIIPALWKPAPIIVLEGVNDLLYDTTYFVKVC
jgi:hypothetical protein